jgi:acetoin utilization protein AcuB
MLVKDRMTSPVITATPETETTAALRTMYTHKIHRLPVVDDRKTLVGIVTQRDLLEKGTAATLLGEIMIQGPYTTQPNVPITHAAALMRNLGVGALPVVDGGQIVGIITESDIFDAFLELLGARRAGTRLIVPLPDIAGGVARLLLALRPSGARLTGLTTYVDASGSSVIVTVDERDPRDLVRAIRDAGFEPALISVQDGSALDHLSTAGRGPET